LTRIIDAHKHNDEALNQPKSCRKGYMGQLRLISNLIQKQATNGEAWMRAYTDGADWVTFCDTYLAQLNDINDGRQVSATPPLLLPPPQLPSPLPLPPFSLHQTASCGGGCDSAVVRFTIDALGSVHVEDLLIIL